MKVRPICASDSKLSSQVLRTVQLEMGVPKIGTAYADTELDNLFETYQNENMQCYGLDYEQNYWEELELLLWLRLTNLYVNYKKYIFYLRLGKKDGVQKW